MRNPFENFFKGFEVPNPEEEKKKEEERLRIEANFPGKHTKGKISKIAAAEQRLDGLKTQAEEEKRRNLKKMGVLETKISEEEREGVGSEADRLEREKNMRKIGKLPENEDSEKIRSARIEEEVNRRYTGRVPNLQEVPFVSGRAEQRRAMQYTQERREIREQVEREMNIAKINPDKTGSPETEQKPESSPENPNQKV